VAGQRKDGGSTRTKIPSDSRGKSEKEKKLGKN
jgi:hypothetical protein